MAKLLKASQEALDEFDEAAKWWGWEQDAGSGISVSHAETSYKASRAVLEARLRYLEAEARRLRKRARQLQGVVRRGGIH